MRDNIMKNLLSALVFVGVVGYIIWPIFQEPGTQNVNWDFGMKKSIVNRQVVFEGGEESYSPAPNPSQLLRLKSIAKSLHIREQVTRLLASAK